MFTSDKLLNGLSYSAACQLILLFDRPSRTEKQNKQKLVYSKSTRKGLKRNKNIQPQIKQSYGNTLGANWGGSMGGGAQAADAADHLKSKKKREES